VYCALKWKEKGHKDLLDLGAGLGRHAIHFAKQGFRVNAIDISDYAIEYAKNWAAKEGLAIDAKVGDMLSLPYGDHAFDYVCLPRHFAHRFARHPKDHF
jgi:2-polyprenyl-3-methyl-5-hydroxy-6-metoxy-1,4-benzoquinol methylase